MTERARRIFLWWVLILGFVGPFVIGAVVNPPIPPVGTHFSARDPVRDIRYLRHEIAWYGFPESAGAADQTAARFLLDIDFVLHNAKRANRPVLAYFTTANDANAVKFDRDIVHAPAVMARLRQFECTALFVDSVPHADKTIAERLRAHNEQLQVDVLGDVASPALVILHPSFDDPRHPERHAPLATAFFYELKDEPSAARFLDSVLEKWSQVEIR